jgi:hypothetical protein
VTHIPQYQWPIFSDAGPVHNTPAIGSGTRDDLGILRTSQAVSYFGASFPKLLEQRPTTVDHHSALLQGLFPALNGLDHFIPTSSEHQTFRSSFLLTRHIN